MPLYATATPELSRRFPDFVLHGEGKTRVNQIRAYQVVYTAPSPAADVGRNVLLLHERPGAGAASRLVMLTAAGGEPGVTEPAKSAPRGAAAAAEDVRLGEAGLLPESAVAAGCARARSAGGQGAGLSSPGVDGIGGPAVPSCT